MSAVLTSPEDVVNLALVRIGYPMRITNMFDGSKASNAALDIYSQTRDELLRQNDWGFAERNVLATLTKQAPAGGYIPGVTSWDPAIYPPIPWLFQYTYPADCLKVRAIKFVPMFLPNFDPQPHIYATPNDNTLSPPAKVIVCNVEAAELVYTGQITNPATWEPDFGEALAAALGRRLAPALSQLPAAQLTSDELMTKAIAEREQG